jgi:hypothetical protein
MMRSQPRGVARSSRIHGGCVGKEGDAEAKNTKNTMNTMNTHTQRGK